MGVGAFVIDLDSDYPQAEYGKCEDSRTSDHPKLASEPATICEPDTIACKFRPGQVERLPALKGNRVELNMPVECTHERPRWLTLFTVAAPGTLLLSSLVLLLLQEFTALLLERGLSNSIVLVYPPLYTLVDC